MPLTHLGPLALTLIASLIVAVFLLAIRLFVVQRVQSKRRRENRQDTQRLRSMVAAYRSLAGSFSPVAVTDRAQLEEALSDIVLFGSLRQVELAAQCVTALARAEPVDIQVLAEELHADLRTQLGLEAIPPQLVLPPSGPRRLLRDRSEGDAARRGVVGQGAAGGGAGFVAADTGNRQE